MGGSAITTGIGQNLAANVKNGDGTSIYNSTTGEWSWKSTTSVIHLGTQSGRVFNLRNINGNAAGCYIRIDNSSSLVAGNTGKEWLVGECVAQTNFSIYNATDTKECLRIDANGACTFGPTNAATLTHTLNVGNDGGNVEIKSNNTLSDNEAVNINIYNYLTAKGTFGVYKHSGITNASSYLSMYAGDNDTAFFYMGQTNNNWMTSTTAGNIGTDNGTVVGTQTSDERTKQNIQPCTKGLETVLALEALEFEQFGQAKCGFSAQRTQVILPSAVYDTKDFDFGEDEPSKLAMDYTQIIAPLVKSIQEQQAIIESLKSRISSLESR